MIKNNKKVRADELLSRLEEPKKYVLLPTPLGPVSLLDKFNIEEWGYAPSSNGKVKLEDPLNVYVNTESERVDAVMIIQ